MPTQPLNSTSYVSAPVTNMAMAYFQDQRDFIATRVFPIVPVTKQQGKYFTFDKQAFLRDDMARRASGTRSGRTGFTLSNSSYNCEVYSLATDLSNQDRSNWDEAALASPDRAKARLLMHQGLQNVERRWATNFFTTSVWGTDSTPGTLWDVSTSTPITDIRTGKSTIKQDTGRSANTLVVGYEVHDALVDHPDIVDRIKHSAGPGNPAVANEQTLAAIFEVDRYIVAGATKATNIENETAAYSFIQGKHALLCYTTSAPSKEEPSAGYTFAWTGVGEGQLAENVAIAKWYDQDTRSDVWEIEMAWDNIATGTDLGYFFNSVVS